MEELAVIIINLAAKYPILASVFLVMGVLRLIFQPLFTFLRSVVDATPTPKDNEWLDNLEKSKAYKITAYVLDLFASVKLPSKK